MQPKTPAGRDHLANLLVAITPGGIERQEAQGQEELVALPMLPKRISGASSEQLTSIGFQFGEDIDDLFIMCVLPTGWSKRATHTSWDTDVLDEQGRVRATIYYTAAFYNRQASMRMKPRFSFFTHHAASIDEENQRRAVVKDAGVVVLDLGLWDGYEQLDELEALAHAWLDERYPKWRDRLAYWDLERTGNTSDSV
ncbi:MAG: hypothetical protein RSG77_25580 [Hafnia sp.]